MDAGRPLRSVHVVGELTLLDLVLAVQEFTRNDEETVKTISALVESGRVRLRTPADSTGSRAASGVRGASSGPARPSLESE